MEWINVISPVFLTVLVYLKIMPAILLPTTQSHRLFIIFPMCIIFCTLHPCPAHWHCFFHPSWHPPLTRQLRTAWRLPLCGGQWWCPVVSSPGGCGSGDLHPAVPGSKQWLPLPDPRPLPCPAGCESAGSHAQWWQAAILASSKDICSIRGLGNQPSCLVKYPALCKTGYY